MVLSVGRMKMSELFLTRARFWKMCKSLLDGIYLYVFLTLAMFLNIFKSLLDDIDLCVDVTSVFRSVELS